MNTKRIIDLLIVFIIGVFIIVSCVNKEPDTIIIEDINNNANQGLRNQQKSS